MMLNGVRYTRVRSPDDSCLGCDLFDPTRLPHCSARWIKPAPPESNSCCLQELEADTPLYYHWKRVSEDEPL